MWPMVTVLAPLIGDGLWGTFIDGHDQVLERWGKSGGRVYGDADIPVDTTVQTGTSPIAVLVDSATASSGEATLVSLIGRPATRSFGRPTAGLASGNDVFRLSDGAMLGITTTRDSDRTGRRYGNAPISPDVVTDAAESDAAAWLRQQPGC